MASSHRLPSPAQPNIVSIRETAEIAAFPKSRLPHVDDYAKACAALIWVTFRASSQWAVAERAERETGLASADTFERILGQRTHKIDGYLMQCVLAVAHHRGVAIPAALAVRIGDRK